MYFPSFTKNIFYKSSKDPIGLLALFRIKPIKFCNKELNCYHIFLFSLGLLIIPIKTYNTSMQFLDFSSCCYLVSLEKFDKLVDVIVGDSIHDFTIVLDQLHHHVGGIQTDLTLHIRENLKYAQQHNRSPLVYNTTKFIGL